MHIITEEFQNLLYVITDAEDLNLVEIIFLSVCLLFLGIGISLACKDL